MDLSSHIKNNKLRVKVKPNSPKNQIKIEDNIVKISIKAKPDKGKANKELINYISKLLKKKVTISLGKTSKNKTLLIK